MVDNQKVQFDGLKGGKPALEQSNENTVSGNNHAANENIADQPRTPAPPRAPVYGDPAQPGLTHPGPAHLGLSQPGRIWPWEFHPCVVRPGPGPMVWVGATHANQELINPGTVHPGQGHRSAAQPGQAYHGLAYPAGVHPAGIHPGVIYRGTDGVGSFYRTLSERGSIRSGLAHPGLVYPRPLEINTHQVVAHAATRAHLPFLLGPDDQNLAGTSRRGLRFRNPGPPYPDIHPLTSNPVNLEDHVASAGPRAGLMRSIEPANDNEDVSIKNEDESSDIKGTYIKAENRSSDSDVDMKDGSCSLKSKDPLIKKEQDGNLNTCGGLSSRPNNKRLYGELDVDQESKGTYHPTQEFFDWLENTRHRTATQDAYHEWLHRTGRNGGDEDVEMTGVKSEPTTEQDMTLESIPRNTAEGVVKRELDEEAETSTPKRNKLIESVRNRLSFSTARTEPVERSESRRNSMLGMITTAIPRPRDTPDVMKLIRIALVGDSGVGKTTLIHYTQTDMFIPAHKTFAMYSHPYRVFLRNKTVNLELWDIPGDSENPVYPLGSALPNYFFDAVLICTSLENKESFNAQVEKWPALLKEALIASPIFMVGLKRDLRPSYPTLRLPFLNEASPVTRDQAEKAAKKIDVQDYFECSAKTGEGVREIFSNVTQYAMSELVQRQRLAHDMISHRRKAGEKIRDTVRRFSNSFRRSAPSKASGSGPSKAKQI